MIWCIACLHLGEIFKQIDPNINILILILLNLNEFGAMIYPEIAILFFVFGVVSGQSPTPCVWLFKSDTNTRGGTPTPYLSLAECQTKCLEFNSCTYGLDWDPNNLNGMRCWFSTGTDIGSAPGVIHYYQSCVETRAPCVWLFKSDTNTRGGMSTSYLNLADCQTKCLEFNSCIYGLDWDSNNANGMRCWFSTGTDIGSAPGVIHYYQSCVETTLPPSLSTTTTSTCNWVPSNNTNTKNGNLKPDANTLDACKEKCFSQLDCVSGLGFDFNANNPEGQRCYLSTSKTLYPTTGIGHYTPENTCSNFYKSTRAPCVWLFKSDTNTRGGMSTSHLSLAECQTKCLEFNSCTYGLDWDPNNVNGMRCWFSTGTDIGSAAGVIHYYQSCAETTLPPSLPTTTTLTCNWMTNNNVYVKNSNLKPDANTPDACKEKCFSQLDCISGFGFDFYAYNPEGRRCYLSKIKIYYWTAAVVVHYTPENTCSNFYKSSSPVQIYKKGSLFLMVLIIVERLFELQW